MDSQRLSEINLVRRRLSNSGDKEAARALAELIIENARLEGMAEDMAAVNALNQYQEGARGTAIYPGQKQFLGLLYTVMGLGGEAGELSNKVKKLIRDHQNHLHEAAREGLINELGDVLWYVAAVSSELGVTLDTVASRNLEKLMGRQAAGTLQGSGDER